MNLPEHELSIMPEHHAHAYATSNAVRNATERTYVDASKVEQLSDLSYRAQGGRTISSESGETIDEMVGEDGRYRVVRTKFTEERKEISGRILVLRRDNYRCVFCGRGGRLEVDHIIPWSAGGSDDLDNLRTLCHGCNQERSNFRVMDDDFRRLPNGGECVNCRPHLIGENDLTPIHCYICNAKAPGLPDNPVEIPIREDAYPEAVERPFGDDDVEVIAASLRADAVATIRAALANQKAVGE